jgi:murein DD-endopeptidase MepM/ murein hydrolase activator NlpD
VRKTVEDAGGEIIWHDGAKGERSMTVTTKSGNTVDLKEGTDFYVDENGTAYFYNNVKTILEAQDMAVDFDENTRNISVTTAAGASVMTLVNGEDFYIGSDNKAHFKNGGILPPEQPAPGAQQRPASPGQTDAEYLPSTQTSMEYGFIWPLLQGAGTLKSKFDIYDIAHTDHKHRGQDIAATAGTPIYAIADGIVLNVVNAYASTTGRGAYIYIDHGNSIQAVYQHNSANLVSMGDPVRQGEVIAKVGSSGHSTGPHLHIEIIIGNPNPGSDPPYDNMQYHVDPLLYLPNPDMH